MVSQTGSLGVSKLTLGMYSLTSAHQRSEHPPAPQQISLRFGVSSRAIVSSGASSS